MVSGSTCWNSFLQASPCPCSVFGTLAAIGSGSGAAAASIGLQHYCVLRHCSISKCWPISGLLGNEIAALQNLVSQLTDYVDDFIGDRLAELPDQDRSSGPLSNLAGPLSAFAAAVLKFKLDSPASVKLLRRLLAALLPDNSAGQFIQALRCAVLCCAVPC